MEKKELMLSEEEKGLLAEEAKEEPRERGSIPSQERERQALLEFTGEGGENARRFTFGPGESEDDKNAKSLFVSNEVSTAKYTPLTFIPINLFEQITKVANLYFLILAVLQCFPAISITEGMPTILLPLSIVILVSMVKDCVEDCKRQRSDREENSGEVLVADYTMGTFVTRRWGDLRVGDLVKVERNRQFPADLILLNSSTRQGICYVETKNLDGETNLKHKIARRELWQSGTPESRLFQLQGVVTCEQPNAALYSFKGVFGFGGQTVPLTYDQLLLRGSVLKNADHIYGIVVYTGAESKIQMNSTRARSKRSLMESLTHQQILVIFCVQLAVCLICAWAGLIWLLSYGNSAQYLELRQSELADNRIVLTIRLFGSWLLMTVYRAILIL